MKGSVRVGRRMSLSRCRSRFSVANSRLLFGSAFHYVYWVHDLTESAFANDGSDDCPKGREKLWFKSPHRFGRKSPVFKL